MRALRPRPSPAGPDCLGHRGGLPVLVQKVSRRVWGLRLRRTVRELALPLPSVWPSAQSDSVGVLIGVFRSSIPSPPLPLLYASRHASRHTAQNSGPSGSLLPSREKFPFSAFCRFIPALSRHSAMRKKPLLFLAGVEHGVHNGVHTLARTGASGPNENHCIRVKTRESEQGERWGIGFLIRGSGVRVPPPLPITVEAQGSCRKKSTVIVARNSGAGLLSLRAGRNTNAPTCENPKSGGAFPQKPKITPNLPYQRQALCLCAPLGAS